MATTIITKNGSGAPLAGDLTAGELAVDLTNKRLYSKDSGGNVIELGTNAGSSTFTDLTVTGDLTVDTDTLVVDSTNNRVGIGESSPSYQMDIKGSGATLRVNSSSGGGAVRIEDASSNYSEIIQKNSTNALAFTRNGTESLTIDSSGNVGIGSTAPTYAKTVIAQNAVGASSILALDNFETGTGNEAVLSMGRSNTANRRVKIRAVGVGNNFTSPALAFDVNESEAMRIDSDGNVGIGTSDPSAPLQILSGGNPNTNAMEVNGAASNGVFALITKVGSADIVNNMCYRFSLDFNNGTNEAAYIDFNRGSSGDNGFLTFGTSDEERMRLDSQGNLMVGTTAPVRKLTVEDSAQVVQYLKSTNAGNACYIEFNNAGSGSNVCRIGSGSGSLLFASGDGTTKATINSSGNLLVGATAASGNGRLVVKGSGTGTSTHSIYALNSDNDATFTVRDDGQVYTGTSSKSPYNNTTSTASNVVVNTSGVLLRSTSSRRYKENIRDYDQTASIDALRPVFFNSKSEDNDKTYAGLIAEEVHEAGFTEFVEYNEAGEPDAVFYANMVALCIKEIQDLKAEVAALKGA